MFKIKFFHKRQAIKDLQSQLHKINDLSPFDYDTYLTITSRFVKRYFGENSDLHNQISKFNFNDFSTLPEELKDVNIEGKRWLKKIEAISFIQSCLHIIQIDGIVQQNRIFLPDILEIVRKYSLTATIVVAIFYLGKWIESNSIHDEVKSIESKCDSLSKSNVNLSFTVDSLARCCNK